MANQAIQTSTLADRERDGTMSENSFRASVKSMIDDAVDYIDGFIAPARANATSFYRGDVFGNEEDGRSKIVMTELRDVVLAMLPSLLRVFTGSEKAVEYEPRKETDVEYAEQATDAINYLFYNENAGFNILHSVFKDALIRKLGIVKWRWDERKEITEASYTGLSDLEYRALTADDDVEVVSVEKIELPQPHQAPMPALGGMMPGMGGIPGAMQPLPKPPPIYFYNCRIRRNIIRKKLTVEAVPPEEFIYSRDARDLDNTGYVGHRSLKTVSELVAMGYDQDDIDLNAGQGDVFILNYEAQTRNPGIMSFMAHADNPDPAMRRLLYVESYVRIDKDGDGVAELRRVCSLGNAHYILHDEIATDVPFATFCPDPEPHMIMGWSVADQVMDLQIIKSGIIRNVMDSLAQSIHPRTAVVEGQVNMDDVMNVETGAIIRMRTPGAVQPFSEPFVGQAALPVIQYLDEVREQRTGMSKATQGLDADVLQSTTKSAVQATVQGAQERLDMTARIFAETGMKRLFRGLLRELVRHQDEPRMIKLRGKWTEIDPKYWDADMNVVTNVGLGRGTEQDRLQFLMIVAQKQEQIIQLLGPSNILCDLAQYRNTLGKIMEMGGFPGTTAFFKPVSEQAAQQMAQASQGQQKPPDPSLLLAQVEQQKTQANIAINQQKMQLEHQKALLDDARERDRVLADTMMRAAEINAKYNTDTTHTTTLLEQAFESHRQQAVAQIEADSAKEQARIAAAGQVQAAQQQPPQPGAPQ